ncbi:ABC transporter permease subunit [Salana multivorans]
MVLRPADRPDPGRWPRRRWRRRRDRHGLRRPRHPDRAAGLDRGPATDQNPQVEEAATSLGAGALTTFLKVTIPLVRPAVITAVTYAITKSMTTITAIIFITTPQTKVMTAQILDEVNAGRFGNAFAYCTVLIVLVLIVLGIANLLLNQLNRSKGRVRA